MSRVRILVSTALVCAVAWHEVAARQARGGRSEPHRARCRPGSTAVGHLRGRCEAVL